MGVSALKGFRADCSLRAGERPCIFTPPDFPGPLGPNPPSRGPSSAGTRHTFHESTVFYHAHPCIYQQVSLGFSGIIMQHRYNSTQHTLNLQATFSRAVMMATIEPRAVMTVTSSYIKYMNDRANFHLLPSLLIENYTEI